MAFLLALLSLCLCWFYGLPGLLLGIAALRNLLRLRKGSTSQKLAVAFKLRWGLLIAWAGLGFSVIFTFVYIIAFATGAYIRL